MQDIAKGESLPPEKDKSPLSFFKGSDHEYIVSNDTDFYHVSVTNVANHYNDINICRIVGSQFAEFEGLMIFGECVFSTRVRTFKEGLEVILLNNVLKIIGDGLADLENPVSLYLALGGYIPNPPIDIPIIPKAWKS